MKLISLSDKRQKDHLWNLSEKQRKQRMEKISRNEDKIDGPIYITAQLSKKNYYEILNGYASIEIPNGTSMKNDVGSRMLEFTCNDENVAEELIDGLDNSGIPWQEDNSTEDVSLSDL